MTTPGVLGIRGRKTRTPLSEKPGHEHYNILPDSVLLDTELSSSAKCVYALLAGSLRKEEYIASIGQRRIASRIGLNKDTVGQALKELAARGHFTASKLKQSRTSYALKSDVFGSAEASAFVAGGTVPREHLQVPCGEAPIFRAEKRKSA